MFRCFSQECIELTELRTPVSTPGIEPGAIGHMTIPLATELRGRINRIGVSYVTDFIRDRGGMVAEEVAWEAGFASNCKVVVKK